MLCDPVGQHNKGCVCGMLWHAITSACSIPNSAEVVALVLMVLTGAGHLCGQQDTFTMWAARHFHKQLVSNGSIQHTREHSEIDAHVDTESMKL